ncbi:MAG: VTT domain-containing protein [Phycisphaerae bacterium]
MTDTAATTESGSTDLPADTISLRRWFLAYGLFLLLSAATLAWLVLASEWSWAAWREDFIGTFRRTSPGIKLATYLIYLSLCCTFLPLPTGWLVAAIATHQASVTPELWSTTLLVATVGATGSMMGNLNDYHLLTWMLRSRRVAKVRNTKLYRKSIQWFSRSPFLLLVAFNIIPIPIDAVRVIATSYRYPRVPFAAANWIGRFLRYGVIAGITFWMSRWNEQAGWIAVLALLVLAIVLVLAKAFLTGVRKIRSRGANESATEVSDPTDKKLPSRT